MRTPTLARSLAVTAGVSLALLAGAGHLAGQANFAGVFPGQPFNGLQIEYTITGAGVGPAKDTEGFTFVRELEGTLDLPPAGANEATLSVFGKARATTGFGASLAVEVCVDAVCKEHKSSGRPAWETSFNVGVLVPHTAQGATIKIEEVGSYNAGSRTLLLTAKLKTGAPGVSGRVPQAVSPATGPPAAVPAAPGVPPAGPGVAPDPARSNLRELILWPMRNELADIDAAEREMERLAAAGVARVEEWRDLWGGAAAFIEDMRQRLLERQARERAVHDLYLGNFDALAHPDGKAKLPEYGVYTNQLVDRAELLGSIDIDRKRLAAELDRWARGEVAVGLTGFPESSLQSLERETEMWRRRVEDARQAINRGAARVGGRAWFFGETDRRGLEQLRADTAKRLRETADRLDARPEAVSLREVGFASVSDVDSEIQNTRRALRDLDGDYQRRDYRLGRWGDSYYPADLESRIAGLQRDQDELRRSFDEGSARIAFPEGGLSRRDLQQRIAEQQQKIVAVNKALAEETYSVDVFGIGMKDARWLKDALASSKDAGVVKVAQEALRAIPVAASVQTGVYDSYVRLYQQWLSAASAMARPAFVRRDLESRQVKQVLAEFDGDVALARARYERRLAWLDRCRQALTGEAREAATPRPQTPPQPPAAPPADTTGAPGAGAIEAMGRPAPAPKGLPRTHTSEPSDQVKWIAGQDVAPGTYVLWVAKGNPPANWRALQPVRLPRADKRYYVTVERNGSVSGPHEEDLVESHLGPPLKGLAALDYKIQADPVNRTTLVLGPPGTPMPGGGIQPGPAPAGGGVLWTGSEKALISNQWKAGGRVPPGQYMVWVAKGKPATGWRSLGPFNLPTGGRRYYVRVDPDGRPYGPYPEIPSETSFEPPDPSNVILDFKIMGDVARDTTMAICRPGTPSPGPQAATK